MVLYLSLIMCPGTSSSVELTKLGGIFCEGDKNMLKKCFLLFFLQNRKQQENIENLQVLFSQKGKALPDTRCSVCLCPWQPVAALCA